MGEQADVGNFIHDNAGWWMMIPAMLMIWGEMALLSALLIETSMEGPLSFGEGGGRRGDEVPRPARALGPAAREAAGFAAAVKRCWKALYATPRFEG